MIKKNTQNYYTVEQMRANYENQNNDEDSSDDSDIMLIENNIFTKSQIVEEIHNSGISISRKEIEFLLGLDKNMLKEENNNNINIISIRG